jgi:hypothetical protein
MQGGVWHGTYATAEYYLQFPFVEDVIISVMERVDISSDNDRIKVIKSPLTENRGQGNMNIQIITSLNGLLECNSTRAVKTRTDQRIFDLEKMNRFVESQPDIDYHSPNFSPTDYIYVLGIQNNFPFSTQDHVYWGYTTDLITLFDIPLSEEPVTGGWGKPEWGDHVQADKGLDFDIHLRMPIYLGAHYYAKYDSAVMHYLDNWREYLTDHAPKREEAMALWNEIKESIFKPFPKVLIYWEKMKSEYPYEMYESQGEYYGT